MCNLKRTTIVIAILFSALYLEAQTYVPAGIGYRSPYAVANNVLNAEVNPSKKWFVSRYSMVSAGYSFFRGGSFNYISAPIGLQLNRKLNNNVYAFAGISVNPTYINFNQPLPLTGTSNGLYGNSTYGSNSFGIYPRAELGLMYVNDEKTFSISGSISVQRGGYTVFPHQQFNTQQHNTVIRPNN
ncbi:hypothetical protein DC498_15880 [Terrimonas sp.]|uniref:hypothetical protein n=1 Tax=Terrimonas sp. TaxID=1914338 RepID=UPI000D51B35B|nr:hypothetical protein [Terrimonas sp.]PVD51131.1 hypothetical protein DC498_15880 [Terrimonas sp.]